VLTVKLLGNEKPQYPTSEVLDGLVVNQGTPLARSVSLTRWCAELGQWTCSANGSDSTPARSGGGQGFPTTAARNPPRPTASLRAAAETAREGARRMEARWMRYSPSLLVRALHGMVYSAPGEDHEDRCQHQQTVLATGTGWSHTADFEAILNQP